MTTITMKSYSEFIERRVVRIALSVPLLLWIILFVTAPKIPKDIRPSIDVHSLYNYEVALLHYLPTDLYNYVHCGFLDVLGAIAYTLHSGWPVVFLVYMVVFKRRDLILPYVNCFGLLCFLALLTQLVMPTAPPWYFYRYGFNETFANYDLKGDPARLIEVDKMFHIQFYQNMFDNSPVVFGSFPSLHCGWPALLALFVFFSTNLPRWLKWVAVAYPVYVALAVIYLQHHYFVDAWGGAFYSVVIYLLFGPKANPQPGHQIPTFLQFKCCNNV